MSEILDEIQKDLNHKCSRRSALKLMGYAAAGVAVGGTFFNSCKTSGQGEGTASSPVAPKTPVPKGSKITNRTWASLNDTVGLLGLGCMRLPRSSSEGHFASIDQEQTNNMVDYSLEHGINYFDTAPAYGESEKAMGIALSRHPRESYLLATKMSNFERGGKKATLEDAQNMFATSLENLKTDYFDYFLLHSLSSVEEFKSRFVNNGVLEYLQGLQKEGKIRHLGFSFHGSNEQMKKMLDEQGVKWDFVQIQLNYVDWKNMPLEESQEECDSETLYNMLVERNIPCVVMEPIRGGALANVSDPLKQLMAQRHPELSPAGMALSFVGSLSGVLVTLSGMSNMEQLTENVATFTDFKPFDGSDHDFMMKVADLYNSNIHIPCTGCSYCMPCPQGVNIPGNFRVFNNASDELRIPNPDGVRNSEYKKKRKAFLTEYEDVLAVQERAEACIQCGACMQKCPQHINIVSQLQNIKVLVSKL